MRKGRNAPKKVGNHCCRGKNTETTQQPLKDFIQMLLVMSFFKRQICEICDTCFKSGE